MSVVDAASRAPATLDPATLDVTAILRHVVDVETSLPPPRGRHPSSNVGNVNAHPDVRVAQLPRYDRRRDATDFDDEDVDLFLVATRTSRVVGAGLVAVSRRGDAERNRLLAMTGIGGGDDGAGSDDDDGDDDNVKKGDGYGDLTDPMGGDRYGPVTICCAYCEEEEDMDEGGGGHLDDSNTNDDDLDEMITCLSLLTLKDCAATQGADGGDNDDHRVAIVLGTSFGRVLSTELGVHYSRGIRRIEGGDGGDNSADPFEPLPLDYDDDDLFEYYDHDGRRHGAGNGSGNNASDMKVARDTLTARGGSGSSGAATKTARDDDDRFFHPEGGVKSIAIHVDRHGPATSSTGLPLSSSMVSVTYGDGTCVRLPHFAFFKSVIESLNASGNGQKRPKVSIQRFKVDGGSNAAGLLSENVLFLPKSHPSMLSPTLAMHDSNTSALLPPNSFSRPDSPSPMSDGDSTEAEGAQASTMDIDDSGQEIIGKRTAGRSGEDNEYDFCEAVTFGCAGESTIQFHSSNQSPPPLFSRGSNDKELNEEEQSQDGGIGLVTGAVVGVAAGVFGAAVGAVSWGLGGGKNRGTRSEDIQTSKDDVHCDDDSDSPDVLPRLRDRPVGEVGTCISILDPPRNITSVVVDPDGDLAATTDTLGRVLLIELSTKQVVRIWKGVRDASCCWIQAPRPSHLSQWGKTNQLYLAIHCGQRRTVEVWRVLHGPRVSIQNVSRNASLIPCIGPAREGSLAKCFILDPSSLASTKNVMASVSINDPEIGLHLNQVPPTRKLTTARKGCNDNASQPTSGTTTKKQAAVTSISSALQQSTSDAIQLQLLKQQLASETNLPSSPDAIFDALIQICSLSDLSTALDLLSTATHLEEGMGIQGSKFHCRVVEHCEKRLDSASEAHATSNNPHLRALRIKIGYHKQLLSGYDVLRNFEAKHLATGVTAEGNDATTADESIPWMKEALGWIEAYATVASSFPGEITAATESMSTVALKFSTFAKSCMPLTAKEIAAIGEEDISTNKYPIHLIDSKRDRTAILLHIFRPLLKDIFVFKVVNDVFDSLGLTKDRKLLQQYFGEWFLSLPHTCWADTGLMVRWLQELVVHVLKEEETEAGNADTEGRRILLGSLYQFCSSCDNLPRAFLLAAICRQAVALATKQQETKTYGKVLSAEEILPWDCLLRKLRVCLLITLRLPGVQLGSFPVTISNIDDGSIFSIYEWVAMDELFLSHNHEKISTLEESCRKSPHSFDPSSADGDEPARWELLQQAGQHRRNPIAPVDGEPGPLLLYFSRFIDPIKLAAHRILLLGEKWGKDPQSIDVLRDAVPALHFLQESREEYQGAVVTAVCIDLWQSRIRPVYRALLFGFDDVPELSEDIVAPLCLDYNWVREVSGVALVVLSLLAQTAGQSTATGDPSAAEDHPSVVTTMTNVATSAVQKLFGDDNATENSHDREIDICNNAWPNARDDSILRNLISRARPASPISLDIHRAIVCAAKLTDDLSSLSYCVPTFTDVFLQGSLFENMTLPTEFSELQEEFINDVVLKKALRAQGPLIDQTELEELETLAYAWGVERIRLRAQFLLHMVDAGKDDMITELANMSGEQLDYPLVVEGGLEIACARLNRIIAELKRAKIFRSILAVLDAETCKWTKKEAEKAADHHIITSAEHGIDEDEDFEWQSPPLSSTHAFVLRLLRMSSSIGDSESSQKAHSLSILSGSLLNAVQEHSELREYDFGWIG